MIAESSYESHVFYLKDGTGNDWPKHRIDNESFDFTSTSCKRPPEIFGATDPTGSKEKNSLLKKYDERNRDHKVWMVTKLIECT